jgi:outer membrane immunogenic protein
MWRVGALVGAAFSTICFAPLAEAADIPVREPAAPYSAPIIPIYRWTGVYAGVQGGGGFGSDKVAVLAGDANFPDGFGRVTNKPSGYIAGGYLGLNYQLGQWVVTGVDFDYLYADLKKTTTDVSPVTAGVTSNMTDKVNWIASATGRIGIAIDRVLIFAKGGWGWANFKSTSAVFTGAVNTSNQSLTSLRSGWTAGAGIEWAVTPNVLIKAEYDYMDLGTTRDQDVATAVGTGVVTALQRSSVSSLNIGKLGVAYKF